MKLVLVSDQAVKIY